MNLRPERLSRLARAARRLIACLGAGVLLVCGPSAQAQQAAAAVTSPPKQGSDAELLQNTEVVRFTLQGRHRWQRFDIDDLDVVVPAAGRRLLPLLRLLNAMEIKPGENGDRVEFEIPGKIKASIDIRAKTVTLNGNTKTVEMVNMQSIITQQRDIYLPPEVMEQMLLAKLMWDEGNYSFLAQIDRTLSIWESNSTSGLAVVTKAVPANLPELLAPARARGTGLDFMQFRLRPTVMLVGRDSNASRVSIDNPEMTLWGSLLTGRFRLDLDGRSSQTGGGGTGGLGKPRIRWVECAFVSPRSELVLGDSRVGLNDLVAPYVTVTGLRFEGVGGKDSGKSGESSAGLRSSFLQPRSFVGYAAVGSTVELFVNDMRIDSMKVSLSSPGAPSGMGAWDFENVGLPAGRMNEIRVEITDPNGTKTQQRQAILGTPLLFPAGKFAYTGTLGTQRASLDKKGTHGALGGGRLIYGVNDRLTLGAAVVAQNGFFKGLTGVSFDPNERDFPGSGGNVGMEFAWLPLKSLLLYGGTAQSYGKWGSSGVISKDRATMLRADLYPSKRLNLSGQYFRYGPKYFNEQSVALHDRQGYSWSGKLLLTPRWALGFASGEVSNNLDGTRSETTRLGFQHLSLFTTAFRNSTLAFSYDRVVPGGGEAARAMKSVELHSVLPGNLRLDGFQSIGDSLLPNDTQTLFSGISLPLVSFYEIPRTALALGRTSRRQQYLGLSYWESSSGRRASVISDLRLGLQGRVLFHTELGRDLESRTAFFENRIEGDLSPNGGTRLGLISRLERGQWSVMLAAGGSALYGLNRGLPRRIAGRSVDPENGAIDGHVFVDENANGIQDPGEPGIGGIRVLGDSRYSAITDRNGYFILPTSSRNGKERVFLDLETVPASYSPTNGTQTALLRGRAVTSVGLGVAPAHCLTGSVLKAGWAGDGTPLTGVRVYLTAPNDNKAIVDSITTSDGTYYLGDVRPGKYLLRVDLSTLVPPYVLADPVREIEVLPKKEIEEIKGEPFEVIVLPPDETAPAAAAK